LVEKGSQPGENVDAAEQSCRGFIRFLSLLPNVATQKSAPEAKPRAFRIAIVIAAAQVYRVVPIFIAAGLLPSYLFPNEVGDFLIGITALPVALSLRRPGLLGWAISAVWFAFGIGDIVQAAGVAVVNGNESLLPGFALAFVLETSGLVLLLSRNTRDYIASRIR
jgi:hypothetical protein